MILNLLEGFPSRLRHEDRRADSAQRADGSVQPEGSGVANVLSQVDEGLGHEEPDHEGEADDD